MFSALAGMGFGTSFPPTVSLCFTVLIILSSTLPGSLTPQPQTIISAHASNALPMTFMWTVPFSVSEGGRLLYGPIGWMLRVLRCLPGDGQCRRTNIRPVMQREGKGRYREFDLS